MQDHFRARVLFPIFDVNDVAVGFGGRVMPGAEGSKYKNSFDSAIYNKSRLLYGLHMAKEEIVLQDESIVCEGYTDVIGFASAEFMIGKFLMNGILRMPMLRIPKEKRS